MYVEESMKACTWNTRGNDSKRVYLESPQQKMLQGKAWSAFFHNTENKNNLIELALNFFRSLEGRSPINQTLVFTCKHKVRTCKHKISKEDVDTLNDCNHLEADIKIIYRGCAENTPVIVVTKDTDVFVLLLYASVLQKS